MSLNTTESTSNSPTARHRKGSGKHPGRSAITNGTALLPGIDQRSAWVRRCKDVIAMHLSDLGGESNTSAAERSLVRRCAVLTTELEMLEAKFAKAEGQASTADIDLYIRGSGSLRRLLESVGLQRRPRTIEDDHGMKIFEEEWAKLEAEEGAA
jgi:hypothetical protein